MDQNNSLKKLDPNNSQTTFTQQENESLFFRLPRFSPAYSAGNQILLYKNDGGKR